MAGLALSGPRPRSADVRNRLGRDARKRPCRAATPHFNSLSHPNAPGRNPRAAAPPGAERSVRRRKTRRKASVLFPFVPPCRAGASQRDALYLLGWRNLILKPVPELRYSTTPHFNSLSHPNAPGRDRRAAASPGAERSVRRRKTSRKASVFFPFVSPCRAEGIAARCRYPRFGVQSFSVPLPVAEIVPVQVTGTFCE